MMLCLHIFLLLRKVILWECNVAICAITLFFVNWHRISLDERPTFSLLVQSKSRQKESTPCFALFPEKLKICLTEIF